MIRQFWRSGLLVALLAGLIASFSLSSIRFQIPDVRAEGLAVRLKTTEEPLDPACNALSKLQINLSEPMREQTTDESGGVIHTCRYQVELVNTDDQYSIMVFTNASGAGERNEPVWHTLHGHKALDPGESTLRDMYVIVYPDGSEESFYFTYLKATFNDLEFPKDCRPMVDHLYTWDLPYRLLDTPCLDLSTDPPEIVEWTPPEGVEVGSTGEGIAEEEPDGSMGESKAGETVSEAAESLTQEQQQVQQGADLTNQLIELLMLGDLGNLDQWDGWAGLNDIQRANLIAIIQRLDERASEYIPPSQLALLDEKDRQEALAQQQQDLLAERLADKFRAWERLDMLINRERARDRGGWALWVYDNYRASQMLTEAYDQVRSVWDDLADPENYALNQAIEHLQQNTGSSIEDAAMEILNETADLANSPARAHYAYYLQQYNPLRAQGISHEDAHLLAMQALREASGDPPQTGGGLLNDDIWLSQNFTDMSAPGGIYDRVFDDLRGNYDPGVTP